MYDISMFIFHMIFKLILECAMAQLVSVSASNANSKIRSSNPAGNKKSFSIG